MKIVELVDEIERCQKRAAKLYARFEKGPNTLRRLVAKTLFLEPPAVVFHFALLTSKEGSGVDSIFAMNMLSELYGTERQKEEHTKSLTAKFRKEYAQTVAIQVRKDYPDLKACYIAIMVNEDQLDLEIEVKPEAEIGATVANVGKSQGAARKRANEVQAALEAIWCLFGFVVSPWLAVHVGPPFADPYKTTVATCVWLAMAWGISGHLK